MAIVVAESMAKADKQDRVLDTRIVPQINEPGENRQKSISAKN